ncbi:hypothetical protein PIB30_084046 [Stylosanthes scabra]|uniref:Uncharacterized protein n=1 Tax=Stylosanthes scabra TaxID=79078 RepID=A0ABU6YV85_9FABA|nr:hypothetical protein [Stylosanthes scabra]
MEFCAKVCHVGGSSGFRPFVPPTVPFPINVAPPDDIAMADYNSADDSDYDEESSCHSTEEDEDIPNTPSVGGPRLVLPAPLPIPNLSEVRSFFQELDLDTRHAEDPTMESVAAEYNTDGGVEFRVGHKMQNRQEVLMSVKNYSIQRNAEYKNLGYCSMFLQRGPKDRRSPHLFGPRDGRGSLLARQHIDDNCCAAIGQDKSIGFGSVIAECCPAELSFQVIVQKSVDGQE